MSFFERFSNDRYGKSQAEFNEFYQEIKNLYTQIEKIKQELARFHKVDEQLKQTAVINQSAVMITQKLQETYRDVQLISESIRKDDQETCAYVRQQRNKINEMTEQFHQELDQQREEFQNLIINGHQQQKEAFETWIRQKEEEKKQQLDEHAQTLMTKIDQQKQEHTENMDKKLDQLREIVETAQKEWSENLEQLKQTLLQKETEQLKKAKQRTLLFTFSLLLTMAFSLGAFIHSFLA